MEKIILLQDHENDWKRIQEVLIKNDINAKVFICEDGVSLKKLIETYHPDYIISDYYMQHLDGIEALMITKQMNPWIPFIFLSSKISEEFINDTVLSDADGYLLKDNIEFLPNIMKIAKNNCYKNKKIQSQNTDLIQLSESVDLHGKILKQIRIRINKMQTQDLIYLKQMVDNIKSPKIKKTGS